MNTSPGRRIENLGDNVSEWCDRTHEGSSTWDVCEDHAWALDHDPHLFDAFLLPSGSEEPSGDDGRSGDIVHPCYDDEPYRCALPFCRVLLEGW